MNPNPIDYLVMGLALVVGLAVGYFFNRYLSEKAQRQQREKADKILQEAKAQAQGIEIQARDNALKSTQAAEAEIGRLRSELNREEERLQKRRSELDLRVERLEQREQTVNKRQSAVDRRFNEIENLHKQQMDELQKIAQMSTDEARAILLNEVEKESRNDMARIIRQIEAEAREEGERRPAS